MTNDEFELQSIDKLIAKEDELQNSLIKQLNESQDRKKSLVQTKMMILGKDPLDYDDYSIPDLLEIIFRRFGKQHVKQAAVLLESEFGRIVDSQTISGALSRYVNRGERFAKAGRNTFDLKREGGI